MKISKTVQPAFRDLNFILGIVSLLLLVLVVALRTKAPTWDEIQYLISFDFFKTGGLTKLFVREIRGSAGPILNILYAVGLYFPGSPVANERLVSVFFLLMTIVAFGATLKTIPRPPTAALELVACPLVLAMGGLIMPEISALFFFVGYLYFLKRALEGQQSHYDWMGAGFCFGIAALCRQNLIAALAPLCLLSGLALRARASSRLAVFFICFAIVTAPTFFIWGSLVPPGSQSIAAGFSWFHGGLALGCAGMIYFCLYHPRRWQVNLSSQGLIFLFVLPLVYFGRANLDKTFLGEFVAPYLKNSARDYYQIFTTGLVLTFAVSFCFELLARLKKEHFRPFEQVLVGTIIFICLSSIKITYAFSVRYVICVVPLIILLSPPAPKDKLRSVTLALGSLVGTVLAVLLLGRIR